MGKKYIGMIGGQRIKVENIEEKKTSINLWTIDIFFWLKVEKSEHSLTA